MIGTNDPRDDQFTFPKPQKIFGFWLLTQIKQTPYKNRKKQKPILHYYHPAIQALIDADMMQIVWHEGTEKQTSAALLVNGRHVYTHHILTGEPMRAKFTIKHKLMTWKFTINDTENSYTVVEYQFTADND